MEHYVAMAGLVASALIGVQAHAAEREGAANARIDGTRETVCGLNRGPGTFAIDAEVALDQEKFLAEEIALSTGGVDSVRKQLVVRAAG